MNQIIDTILSDDIRQIGEIKILLSLYSVNKQAYTKLRESSHLRDSTLSHGIKPHKTGDRSKSMVNIWPWRNL